MPAVLTHHAVMLMARERLAAIQRALSKKLLQAGAPKSDLEHRVMYLADQAQKMMSDLTLTSRGVIFPQGAGQTMPLGRDVSPFSIMGSMGGDLTATSALLARGQAWVFDTIHKGTPDANREAVAAGTCDFVLEFWNRVSIHAAAGSASPDDVRKMRAYVLGHLCHVATDVLSHPYVNDLEWHLGNRSRKKMSHSGGEGIMDARVAQQIFLRESTREGQDWDMWWPSYDEVPDVYFAAYAQAMDACYQATTHRPRGFGEFEAKFARDAPPVLTVDFVRDGYRVYRNGIVGIGYGWGYGRWFSFLIPLTVPLSALIGLAWVLPHGREFFSKPWRDVSERAWFEMLTLPLAVGSILPAFYGIWLSTLTTLGVEGLSRTGLVLSIACVLLAAIFFSLVGTAGDGLPPWARWFLFFVPLLAIPLVFTCIALPEMKWGDGKHGALSLIYGLPFLLWFTFMVGFLIVTMFLGWVVPDMIHILGGEPGDGGRWFSVFWMALFALALLLAWFLLPRWLPNDMLPVPEKPRPFAADRPHFVRAFDDSTLFHDPAKDNPTARELFFPAGRRKLLKLWWEGDGDLYVRSEQRQLAFSQTGEGAPSQTVPAPIIPMKVGELAQALEKVVPGLKAAPVYPEDESIEYFLPTGATFSEDVEEGKEEEEGLPAKLFAYKKLAKSEADASYVLRHADKAYQSIRFGRRGPIGSVNPEDENVSGPGKVTSNGTTVAGTDTAFHFFFDPGDQIAVGTQVRIVTQVRSDTELEINAPFSPALSDPSSYLRVGPGRERSEGYTYLAVPSATQAPGGDSVMDYAADLAALLCLGMTSHLLPAAERRVPSLDGAKAAADGSAIDGSVGKVYQVFRNWSLDRRRVNEWRMLVAGSARSEKATADEYDAAMPQPAPPAADWQPARVDRAGEPVANAQGWVPVLRQWLARVGTGDATSAAAPPSGGPSNLDLSHAMAFLLDLQPPKRLA